MQLYKAVYKAVFKMYVCIGTCYRKLQNGPQEERKEKIFNEMVLMFILP